MQTRTTFDLSNLASHQYVFPTKTCFKIIHNFSIYWWISPGFKRWNLDQIWILEIFSGCSNDFSWSSSFILWVSLSCCAEEIIIPIYVMAIEKFLYLSSLNWLLQEYNFRMARGFQVWKFHLKISPWANFWRWRNFHTWNSAHSEILYLPIN